MRRYPAFDPPEYVNWTPDPEAMAAFKRGVPARLPEKGMLLRLYEGMVRNRLYDIALKRWVRQGAISKAWLGTGEEAVTIGNVHALRKRDVVGPMIRNAGACHEMGIPLTELLKVFLGAPDTAVKGRDIHIGDLERGVIAPTSFVGALVPVFAGLALSFKMKGEDRVAMTWVGDGARWTGAFHEGMSLAAARGAPLVIVLQDNQVALGTPVHMHSRTTCDKMAEAYGVQGMSCDGNNVLDVHAVSREAVERCRKGEGPVIVTATTFRMGGHATHDEAEARDLFPPDVFAHWGKRDPIGAYETWLLRDGGIDPSALESIERRVTGEVESAAEAALAGRDRISASKLTMADLLSGVYSYEGNPTDLIEAR